MLKDYFDSWLFATLALVACIAILRIALRILRERASPAPVEHAHQHSGNCCHEAEEYEDDHTTPLPHYHPPSED